MVNVLWSDKAEHQLKKIHDFIAEDSHFYAQQFIQKIIASTSILQLNPESGRIVPEFNETRIREIIYKNYRIVYLFESGSNTLTILNVSHGSAQLPEHLKD